jgi:hypothetical protein
MPSSVATRWIRRTLAVALSAVAVGLPAAPARADVSPTSATPGGSIPATSNATGSPRDASQGVASGRRQSSPITVTK